MYVDIEEEEDSEIMERMYEQGRLKQALDVMEISLK